jgi:hypothetical protein
VKGHQMSFEQKCSPAYSAFSEAMLPFNQF